MYATPEVQHDPRVVSAAVRKSGWALEFASLALRGNRTIVIEAVWLSCVFTCTYLERR